MKEGDRSNYSLASIGVEMAAAVVLGLVGGLALDAWLGTRPWLMLVGLGVGIAAAFKPVIELLKDDEEEDRDKG